MFRGVAFEVRVLHCLYQIERFDGDFLPTRLC
jgi:hypothetical protein